MRATTLILGSIITLWAGTAAAQSNAAAAETLFKQGKQLMDKGQFAEACTAFEGSYAKDPVVSTLLNLANCREKNGQFASAYGAFVQAERDTRRNPDQANLNATARTRASALEPRLSYLIINVPDESRVDGLTITRNGDKVDTSEWNQQVPVDGGEYKVEGKAPAYEAWSTTVKVAPEKDKQSVNVPRFRALPASVTTPGEPAGGAVAADRPSSFTGKRKAAVGLWAAGAIGLSVGVVMELGARGAYNDAKAETMSNDRRQDLVDEANDKRTLATIAAGAGGALVAGGVVLWILGKPASMERAGVAIVPRVTPGHAGLSVSGHF